MCGISGFTFPDESLIREMNTRVKHRGPDGDGVFVAPQVSLGQTRLAILDLTERGIQPMKNGDASVVVVFNGEIYNFQELRDELQKKGYQCRSTGDTEVILHAYEAYGINCVEKFNGIFAIAIWDARKETLYLARDHTGVKPLYYFFDGARLIFSSEIKAILAHDVPRDIDRDALNVYFRMLYVPAPRTMFRHIKKVEPGTYLVCKKNAVEMHRYWQPPRVPMISSKQEAIESIRSLMRDSVRRQLVSERPVGVFLSGGIDSTAILGLATEVMGVPPKTFSAGFDDVSTKKFNADLTLARETATRLGADHHELIVSGADCARVFEDVVYHMDEPVANATQAATYLLSQFARDHIVVALGGDGGDELFGGYERYRLSRMVSFYQKLPLATRRLFTTASAMLPLPQGLYDEIAKLDVAPGAPRYLSFMAQKEAEVARVLAPEANDGDAAPRLYAEQFFSAPSADAENDFMWADICSWLPDESLVRSDKLSMAWALEQRVPILDHRLVELSLRIPSRMKLAGGTKGLFREAMRPYVPAHILNQPKRGWFSPASNWLRTAMKPIAIAAFDPAYAPGTEEFIDFPALQKLYQEHLDARGYHMPILWAALTFQVWYRKFMAGRP